MYGILRTAGCGLPVEQRQAWWGHMCGLCLALGMRFGQPARLATNSDAALVIALCEAQSEKPIPKTSSLCLLRRPLAHLVDDPSDPAVSYASGAAMLIAANKLRDNLQDDPNWLKGLRSPVQRLAERWRSAAEEYLAVLGFQSGLVESQFQRQGQLEAQPGGDFSTYSQPTELAVGAVFAHTARLQNKPHNVQPLFEIGRGYGRIMLLVDAYQDYEQDRLARHFNPLAAAFPCQDWRRPAQSLFHQAYSQLRQAVAALDLSNTALLHNLLLRQLVRAGHHSLGLCHAAGAGIQTATQVASDAAAHLDPLPGPGMTPFESPQDNEPLTPDTRPCCDCRGCCNSNICYNCHCPPCGEGSSCDCNPCEKYLSDCVNCCGCGDCNPFEYDWSGCCDCGTCDCSSCDCGNCDCGGCDCSNCDCGGCDCNCN